MKVTASICLIILLLVHCENKKSELDFLIGTWKIEDKEQYEVWKKNDENGLIGHSYTLDNDKKMISETLSLKKIDNQIIYEATVLNQNDGKPIQFRLNNDITAYFSFENDKHDFPKKIQYEKIGNYKIKVTILGDKNKGFSYVQIKQ